MNLLNQFWNWFKIVITGSGNNMKNMETAELKEGARQLVEIIDCYATVGKEMLNNCSKIKGDADGNLTYQQHTLIMLLSGLHITHFP